MAWGVPNLARNGNSQIPKYNFLHVISSSISLAALDLSISGLGSVDDLHVELRGLLLLFLVPLHQFDQGADFRPRDLFADHVLVPEVDVADLLHHGLRILPGASQPPEHGRAD